MPMDFLGGYREDRILITHGVQVEKTEVVPEQRMRDKPALRDREMDGQSPSFEAMIDVGGALNLKDQARGELTANVGFEVAPFVVRHWLGYLEAAVATQHEELHELLLGDEALLGGTDRRHGLLDPKAQSLQELGASMDFEVVAFVVLGGPGDLEFAATPKAQKPGELALGEDALLGRIDR
jgi:hypothetical protein